MAPGGDESIWENKLYSGWMQIQIPILMMNQGCFKFVKNFVGQMTIFRKKKNKTFSQTTFRSKYHFLEKAFGQMNFRSNILSVKWPFFEKAFVK
jgi:hypothetical protein